LVHIDSRRVAIFYTKPSHDVDAHGASTSSLGFVVGHRMDAFLGCSGEQSRSWRVCAIGRLCLFGSMSRWCALWHSFGKDGR
jgi:hypothetical protein